VKSENWKEENKVIEGRMKRGIEGKKEVEKQKKKKSKEKE
jgi:hypothetical protein